MSFIDWIKKFNHLNPIIRHLKINEKILPLSLYNNKQINFMQYFWTIQPEAEPSDIAESGGEVINGKSGWIA
jgi:hypothetical protein